MKKEIKFRVHDRLAAEQQIASLGFRLEREVSAFDIYFDTGSDDVVKLSIHNSIPYRVELASNASGGFTITKRERINDLSSEKESLLAVYTIRKELTKVIRYWVKDDYTFSTNIIDDLGDFLILTGRDVTKDILEETFGFSNPDYVTVSFDKL